MFSALAKVEKIIIQKIFETALDADFKKYFKIVIPVVRMVKDAVLISEYNAIIVV